MHTVNIAEARANLAKLIDLVVKGEQVIISRRGKPLVRLSSVKVEGKG